MKTLYKRTSTGAVQTWRQEIDGHRYRTISGHINGAQTESKWKESKAKNTGRSNATTPEEQAILDVESNYRAQLKQGNYWEDINDIDKVRYFVPMTALDWHDYKPTEGYSQPKMDGIRCILKRDGMWSRNGDPIISCPHIINTMKEWFDQHPDDVFDGELYSDNLADNFQKIISLARKTVDISPEEYAEAEHYLKLHVYDYPSAKVPFGKRFASFGNIYTNQMDVLQQSYIVPVETTYVGNLEEMDAKYAEYMEAGFEGQMIRNDSSVYEHKRAKQLLKRKEFCSEEFKVLDIIEGNGNWSGVAKSIKIELKDGTTQQTGMRGTLEFARELLRKKDKHIGGECTVIYQRLSNDGKLIFPISVAFFDSKRNI